MFIINQIEHLFFLVLCLSHLNFLWGWSVCSFSFHIFQLGLHLILELEIHKLEWEWWYWDLIFWIKKYSHHILHSQLCIFKHEMKLEQNEKSHRVWVLFLYIWIQYQPLNIRKNTVPKCYKEHRIKCTVYSPDFSLDHARFFV